jgi:hypothetical protein
MGRSWMALRKAHFSATFKLFTSFCSGKNAILSGEGTGSYPMAGGCYQE